MNIITYYEVMCDSQRVHNRKSLFSAFVSGGGEVREEGVREGGVTEGAFGTRDSGSKNMLNSSLCH